MQFVKYKCGKCSTVFIADSRHHHMDYCPVCGDTSVDLEDHCCRFIGSEDGYFPKFIEAFNPPWFENEEEYHSAMLGWLNDSDEEFKLHKEKGFLYIFKVR